MDPRSSTSTRSRLDRDLHGIGRLVLEKGLASRDEVDRCLTIQRESADSGVFLRLGEILVREGLISADQVQTLLALQRVQIQICVRCFAQFNVEDWSDEKERGQCPKCGGALVEARELKSLAVEDTVGDAPKPSEESLAILDANVRKFGDYEILGEISRGGMGIVYKARHRELDRIVALKVLLAGGESSYEQVLRFQREARAVARLRHPNIVGIHEIGEHRSIHYFSMDYVPGVSLEQKIGRPEPGRDVLIDALILVCEAVHTAHEGGVLHRDLKPSNILLTRDNEPFLIDFGIAHVHGQDVRLTRQGYIFGSPLYMAPEYVAGTISEFTVLCDVYALGVILYQILGGVTPFEDVETIQVLSRILKEEAAPIDEVVPDLPLDLSTISSKAIARLPEQRYATAQELADDLRRFRNGEPILARPRPKIVRFWQKQQHQILAGAGLLLGAIVLIGAYVLPKLTLGAISHLEAERNTERRTAERARNDLEQTWRLLEDAASRLAELGDHIRALAIIETLCNQRPAEAHLHRKRAELLWALGRGAEAEEAQREADRLDPATAD